MPCVLEQPVSYLKSSGERIIGDVRRPRRPSLPDRPSPYRRSTDPKHINTVGRVHALLDELFEADVHVQRLRSLKDGVVGVVEAGQLSLHAIGRGLSYNFV